MGSSAQDWLAAYAMGSIPNDGVFLQGLLGKESAETLTQIVVTCMDMDNLGEVRPMAFAAVITLLKDEKKRSAFATLVDRMHLEDLSQVPKILVKNGICFSETEVSDLGAAMLRLMKQEKGMGPRSKIIKEILENQGPLVIVAHLEPLSPEQVERGRRKRLAQVINALYPNGATEMLRKLFGETESNA